MRDALRRCMALVGAHLLGRALRGMKPEVAQLYAAGAIQGLSVFIPAPEPAADTVTLTTTETEWLWEMVRARQQGHPIIRVDGVQ